MEDPDDRKVKLMHLGQTLANFYKMEGADVAYAFFQDQIVRRYNLTERELFSVVFRAGVLCECKSWKDDANEAR